MYFEGNGDGTFVAPVVVGNVTPTSFGIATPPAPPIRSTIAGIIFNDQNGNGVDDILIKVNYIGVAEFGQIFRYMISSYTLLAIFLAVGVGLL